MTRMTGPDCAVMCNLIKCEWHRTTRMTGPDYAAMYNLIHKHNTLHAHRNVLSEYLNVVMIDQRILFKACLIPQLGDQYIHPHVSRWYEGSRTVG